MAKVCPENRSTKIKMIWAQNLGVSDERLKFSVEREKRNKNFVVSHQLYPRLPFPARSAGRAPGTEGFNGWRAEAARRKRQRVAEGWGKYWEILGGGPSCVHRGEEGRAGPSLHLEDIKAQKGQKNIVGFWLVWWSAPVPTGQP